ARLLLVLSAPPGLSALSLHDALPISALRDGRGVQLLVSAAGLGAARGRRRLRVPQLHPGHAARRARLRRGRQPRLLRERRLPGRSEEHTSELQSRENLVCRLLLEKKK